VGGRYAVLAAQDGQITGLEVNLIPTQGNGLADAKAMAVNQQQESAVASTVSAR
jgi:hypothetical protein